ncbi:hypothetical protein BH11PSE13_BH11PSE13_10990 [soil metagenome]
MRNRSSSLASRRRLQHLRLRPLAMALACVGAGSALAASPFPMGGIAVRGLVDIGTPNGTTMTIGQTSARAIVNWNDFSLGAGNTLNITQTSGPGSVLLNRVINNGPRSEIFGTINAPGHVFIVNPAGVVFGASSQINVGGLVASTLDIGNDSLMPAGKDNTLLGAGDVLTFTRADGVTGKIELQASGDNRARITTSTPGGAVVLMGETVSNAGVINVAQGSVGLLSGRSATIDYGGGDGLTTFKVASDTTNIAGKALIENLGRISADGGRVSLIAASSQVGAMVVNQQGTVQARSMVSHNGQIVLAGGGNNEVVVGGSLDATGTANGVAGGSVQVTAGAVRFSGATVDASGTQGGSVVAFGGGVTMSPEAALRADGTTGKGGQLLLAASEIVHVDGKLSARGATDGGTIGTGGGAMLEVTQGAVIEAGGGSGANGKWNAQSSNDLAVTNDSIPYLPTAYTDANTRSRVHADAVGRSLSRGTDVTLSSNAAVVTGQSAGDGITFETGTQVIKTAGPTSTLTVNSVSSIAMASNASIGSTQSAGALNVDFNADSKGASLGDAFAIQDSGVDAIQAGAISMQGASIATNGGNVRFYGQTDADNGRAVGFSEFAGVTLDSSRLSTCAIGSTSCGGTAGSISVRGEGGTTRFGDVNALSGIGVDMRGSSVQTGTGDVTIDGRGGISSAGVSIAPVGTGSSTLASTIASGSGDVRIAGSSRSWLTIDPTLFVTGKPNGVDVGYGAGTGVAIVGADISTGGNVLLQGKGGDMSRILDDADRVGRLAGTGVGFAAGAGVIAIGAGITAGRGKTIDISGTAGSRAYAFTLDATENVVVTPSDRAAVAVGIGATAGRSVQAEGGTIRVDGGTGDIALLRIGADAVVGPDGPSSMLSTASTTGTGGTIDVRGANVLVQGLGGAVARLDSSGVGQAGTVSLTASKVAGVTNSGVVALDSSARLDANGIGSGNGGHIGVIGDNSLFAYGSISARGGASGGNGGFVETSAPTFVMAGLKVDAAAPAGAAGKWLIDPFDVSIVNGAATNSLTGNPFVPVATSIIQDGDINAALNGGTDVTITTGTTGSTFNGNITMTGAQIAYVGAGDRTFELDANRSITADTATTIASSNGRLNVVFNADANKISTTGGEGGQVIYNGQIYTNGGNVAMSAGWTPNAGGSSAIALNGAIVDTRVGRTDAGAGGNVVLNGASGTLFGNINNDSAAVFINSSQISTSTGNVVINGTSTTGTGVELSTSQLPASISTTSGNVAITGLGTGRPPAGSGALLPSAGVLISRASIGTVSGGIVLHGYVNDPPLAGALRAGVLVQDGARLATTGGGDIELTGRAANGSAGVAIVPGVPPVGVAALVPAVAGSGDVVLRAANNATTDALVIAAPVSAGGVIDLRPGGTDATGIASDAIATPITLGSAAGIGFDVSSAELGFLSAPTIVAGSNAQAADITVVGAVGTAGGLTLQNGGGGNSNLNAPVSAGTLGLIAGGSVLQSAGAPITAGTMLASAQTGSVLLGNPANNVAIVGGNAAGRFEFVNAGPLTLGSVAVNGFDAAANQPQPVVASSMAADTLFARALTGDLSLGTDVASRSGADLVAATGRFQNLGTFGIAGAPWRVWANTWVGESRGGMAGSGFTPNLYHCAYLGLCTVAITPADNHFIYAQQPVATVVIDDTSRFFGQPNPPFFTYSITGLILGDTPAGFPGSTSTTANPSSAPGLYPIAGTFQSAAGYAVTVLPGTLQVLAEPVIPVSPVSPVSPVQPVPPVSTFRLVLRLPDVLRDVPNTYTFDRNIGPAPICYATGPLDGDRAAQGADVLAREWSRVRSRPNLLSCVDTERRNGCADF